MGRFLFILIFVIFINLLFANAQTIPIALDSTITVSKLLDVSSNIAAKIDVDPISGDIYYTTLYGFIYRIYRPNGQPAYDSLVYTTSDHQINNMQGMCFYDSTMYITGNTSLDANNKRSAIIVRGKLQSNGTRLWSVVAESERYAGATYFDHMITSIIPTPNGDSLLVSSGARGDHGEVDSFNGMYPGKRLEPISSKILKIPANGNNFFIPNDSTALDTLHLVYAEGLRNNFDMAYNASGELFGTENSGDRDMDEELNWLREGHHYGFPWYMGNELNPSQFATYNPLTDIFINPASYAMSNGQFTIDTTFPAPPPGLMFTAPCANEGPDADNFRDSVSGTIMDATAFGSSVYSYSFTAHRSPLGLSFDNDSVLDGIYRGGAFVCSYTRGDSTRSGYSELMANMGDDSEDLLFLDLRKNPTNDNYIFSAKKVIEKLNNPADAVLIKNKMYILETGNVPGPSIWEVTFPEYCSPDSTQFTFTTSKKNVTCTGVADGNASVIASGGKPPYTYHWNTNPVQTVQIIQNLEAGIYTATVTDSVGCSAGVSIEIREPDPLLVFYIPTHTNPPGTASGEINLLVSGAIAPYNYTWSNGATTEDISNIFPGVYYSTVVDNNGCAILTAITIN